MGIENTITIFDPAENEVSYSIYVLRG